MSKKKTLSEELSSGYFSSRILSLNFCGEGKDFFELILANPGIIDFTPGQFAMLRPALQSREFLLARPFSIMGLDEREIRFFIRKVGVATELLADLPAGAEVFLWGPLGRGFVKECGESVLLLAAGVGLAPLLAYAKSCAFPERCKLFFGHRSSETCYPLERLDPRIRLAKFKDETPEDLPKLRELLQELVLENRTGLTLACGPRPFLQEIWRTAREHKIPKVQLSLENHMACGVGACLGCVEKASGNQAVPGYVCVCKDGPVFYATDICLD